MSVRSDNSANESAGVIGKARLLEGNTLFRSKVIFVDKGVDIVGKCDGGAFVIAAARKILQVILHCEVEGFAVVYLHIDVNNSVAGDFEGVRIFASR